MLLSATMFAIIALGQSSSGQAARAEEQQRLVQCIELVKENPQQAYDIGLAWINEGGRPFARQCTALALVELGQAAEGAVRLEDLANAANGGSVAQRVIYLTQSGNAWLVAGKPEAALVTLQNALRLNPNDPNLYADRAAAYIALEQWTKAELDLDLALQSLSTDTDVLRMRAETRLALGDLDGAKSDVMEAMNLDITDIKTLNLRGRIINARIDRNEEAREQSTSPLIIGNE